MCLLIISCAGIQKEHAGGDITINPLLPDSFLLSDFIEKLEVIPLQATEDIHVVIDEQSKIYLFRDKIFILDRANNALMVFSKDGAYENSIGNAGNGHGEFIELTDFAIESNEVFILDAAKRQILKYDVEGEYISTLSYDENFYDFIVANRCFWFLNSPPASKSKYFFTCIDSDGQTTNHIERGVANINKTLCGGGQVFSVAGDIVYASPRFENTIYKINNNSIIPIVSIDFGENTCPEEELAKVCGSELIERYAIKTSFFASKDYLVIGYCYKDIMEKYCFIDTKDNTVSYGKPHNDFFDVKDGYPFGFSPLWGNDGYLIQKMEPYEILGFCPALTEYDSRLKTLKDDSAPVLLLYRMKR